MSRERGALAPHAKLLPTDEPPCPCTGQQINIAEFPELDQVPPTNSAEVRRWIQEVAAKGAIPNVPTTGIDGCSNTTYNAQALKDAGADGNCWWTCGGCER